MSDHVGRMSTDTDQTTHRPAPVQPTRVAIIPDPRHDPLGHETTSLAHLAERIADVLGIPFAGVHEGGDAGDAYLIPAQTLVGREAAALGIHAETQLFGGVVPHSFVKTKVITHPAVDRDATVPDGWSWCMESRLGESVLPGYSVFDADAARRGFRALRHLGPLRLKLARGRGGNGQYVLEDEAALQDALDDLPADELSCHGATLEQHLEDSSTYSVGVVRLGDMVIAYCGTQREVPDRDGNDVYGGSRLRAVRGGFDALLDATGEPGERCAVRQALDYDAAVRASYPGFFATRTNYDIIAGRDAEGQRRSGVLEQSWRIGGATPAELAAIEAFGADGALDRVVTACYEVHELADVPEDARVHYRAVDPRIGPITKYSRVEARGHDA